MLPSAKPKQETSETIGVSNVVVLGATNSWVMVLVQTGLLVSVSVTTKVYTPTSVKLLNVPVFWFITAPVLGTVISKL